MIQRVARVLAKGEANDPDKWRQFERGALDILTAMREPTEGMETAGVLPAMSRDPARTWTTMIDAALAEGE
jgi:hypothetical protein